MPSQNRELTGREKQRIKKLITSLCANYDKEYGCLPLDCDCPMFGICYTNSALCRYFRAVLPTDAKLQAVFRSEPTPLTACGQCGKPFPADGKRLSLMFAFSRINGYTIPEPIILYENFMNFSTGGAYGK